MDPIRILVAEDEPDIALILEATLQAHGFAVTTAGDGEEALAKAQEDEPALLLLDLMMPRKTGYEVCRALREDPRFSLLPIVMLTAKSQTADRLLGFEVGADDYILKPFDPNELVARIRAVLRRRLPPTPQPAAPAVDLIPVGLPALDEALGGGLSAGSNLLVMGAIGSGKSSLARAFLATGLARREPCLFLSVDDNPAVVRRALDRAAGGGLSAAETADLFRLVDAYSWCAGAAGTAERFAVSGVLELTQLSGVVSDAAAEVGQTVRAKRGGRRVADSISSLLVNFELPAVQRFVAHLARSAAGFGGVSSLFLVESSAVSEQVLANIRYVMDGVLECRREGDRHQVQVVSMKWRRVAPDWLDVTSDR